MRLVCPNCDAKYEVPEDAIPETGRDVQCANCGHAWFQMRPRTAETAPAAAPVVSPVVAPVPAAVASPEPEPEPLVEAAAPGPVEPEPTVTAEAVAEAVPIADDLAADAIVTEVAVPAEPEVVEPVAEDAVDLPAAMDAVPEPVVAEVALAEALLDAPVAADNEAVAEVVAAPVADPVVQADVTADATTEAAEDAVDVPASTGAIAAAGVAAYAVDESVLAILREEAERETQARKAEAAKPLETQTDLGLDAAMPAARKEPVAMPSDLVSGDETPEDRHAVRRTRLPDVEEINSTLRPSETAEDDAAAIAPVAEGRSSFRSGFLLVMTLAILASALYGSADAIAAAVPALAGPLKGFVSFVDSLRLHLDGLMQSATVAINGD